MRSLSELFAVLAALLLGGCAMGSHHDYASSTAQLNYTGNSNVAIAVWDHRSYVRSGDKRENFVGLQRGSYGNPFDVLTQSGRPLATDMSEAFSTTLKGAGYATATVQTSSKENSDAVKARLFAMEPARGLLLQINEWKSDTYKNTSLAYDVTLAVYNVDGKRLALKRLQGRDDLSGSYLDPVGAAKDAVPTAFKAKIEALLDAPEVVAAMR